MIVGLTGGIASGKSTVSAYFAQKGLPVFDADAVSRRITEKGGPGAQAIAGAFGRDSLIPTAYWTEKSLRNMCFATPRAPRGSTDCCIRSLKRSFCAGQTNAMPQ